MRRGLFSPRCIVQAVVLLVTAAVLGFLWNALWPKGVKTVLRRPSPMSAAQGEDVGLAEITIAAPGGAAKPPAGFAGLRYVTLDQLDSLRLVPGAVLVDARSAKSYMAGRIPGAVNLPVDELPERQDELAQISRAPLVLVYCDDPRCDAAERLAEELLAGGARSVAIYHDGIRGWMAAGRAVTRDHSSGAR
ncbi:MAG: rhodanese-like domain-containing protein [candidate division KSB1 bacterium]|nr:rhodanese-like domain-containing protein [candidate division KSB1 bacterium]